MSMRQAEEQATRNGISALQEAFTEIEQHQQAVQSSAVDLANNYQGSDGGKFRNLMEAWDTHVDTILVNLDHMIDELNQSLTDQGLLQGSANDEIDQASSRSNAVFDELNGNFSYPGTYQMQ